MLGILLQRLQYLSQKLEVVCKCSSPAEADLECPTQKHVIVNTCIICHDSSLRKNIRYNVKKEL